MCYKIVIKYGFFPLSIRYVDWYLDDKQIGWNMNKVPGWSVDSVPSSHHHNTIKLRSTSRQIITATLHCMVKGDYSKNFVNIYHLIQAPKETCYGLFHLINIFFLNVNHVDVIVVKEIMR